MDNLENKIAKVLYYLGFVVIILGTISAFVLGKVYEIKHSGYGYSFSSYNWTLTIITIVSSIVVGILFIAFGEVINLLQQNVDNQQILIKRESDITKTIEQQKMRVVNKSNSSSTSHKFRCSSCGEMISEYPCCVCGFKFN